MGNDRRRHPYRIGIGLACPLLPPGGAIECNKEDDLSVATPMREACPVGTVPVPRSEVVLSKGKPGPRSISHYETDEGLISAVRLKPSPVLNAGMYPVSNRTCIRTIHIRARTQGSTQTHWHELLEADWPTGA